MWPVAFSTGSKVTRSKEEAHRYPKRGYYSLIQFCPDLSRLETVKEMVGGRSARHVLTRHHPLLDHTFHRLQSEGRARLDWTVPVPVVGRSLKVPYAYRNGNWNLVKPQTFTADENQSTNAAMRLAVEGHLLRKHGADAEGEKRLIVVSSFEADAAREHVTNLLDEYAIKQVSDEALSAFVAQVEREAHV